jgi:hypothetical protein
VCSIIGKPQPFFYCNKCGVHWAIRATGVHKPCQGNSSHSKHRLRKIHEGHHPSSAGCRLTKGRHFRQTWTQQLQMGAKMLSRLPEAACSVQLASAKSEDGTRREAPDPPGQGHVQLEDPAWDLEEPAHQEAEEEYSFLAPGMGLDED